jgi:hypothetical protein
MLAVQRTDRSTMPQTFFHVPAMHSQADAATLGAAGYPCAVVDKA